MTRVHCDEVTALTSHDSSWRNELWKVSFFQNHIHPFWWGHCHQHGNDSRPHVSKHSLTVTQYRLQGGYHTQQVHHMETLATKLTTTCHPSFENNSQGKKKEKRWANLLQPDLFSISLGTLVHMMSRKIWYWGRKHIWANCLWSGLLSKRKKENDTSVALPGKRWCSRPTPTKDSDDLLWRQKDTTNLEKRLKFTFFSLIRDLPKSPEEDLFLRTSSQSSFQMASWCTHRNQDWKIRVETERWSVKIFNLLTILIDK